MPLYILDTDHVSLFQRKHAGVLSHIEKISRTDLATTIVTAEEQIQGRFKVIKRATTGSKLVTAYSDLQNTLNYFELLAVLPFDESANAQYENLRQQKIRIGTYDLRIAAITLSVSGILVTRNHIDFARVPKLEIEDWSA